jgi:hypothetical protein
MIYILLSSHWRRVNEQERRRGIGGIVVKRLGDGKGKRERMARWRPERNR